MGLLRDSDVAALMVRLEAEISADPHSDRDVQVLRCLRWSLANLKPGRQITMEQAIERVLVAHGRPMRAREILQSMSSPPTFASRPITIVGKWLSKSTRFRRVAPGLYTLADSLTARQSA